MDLRLIGSPLPIHVHDFGWQSVLVVFLSYIPGLIVYYQGVREQGRKLNKNEKITFIFIAILCVLSIVLIANKKINIM